MLKKIGRATITFFSQSHSFKNSDYITIITQFTYKVFIHVHKSYMNYWSGHYKFGPGPEYLDRMDYIWVITFEYRVSDIVLLHFTSLHTYIVNVSLYIVHYHSSGCIQMNKWSTH